MVEVSHCQSDETIQTCVEENNQSSESKCHVIGSVSQDQINSVFISIDSKPNDSKNNRHKLQATYQ